MKLTAIAAFAVLALAAGAQAQPQTYVFDPAHGINGPVAAKPQIKQRSSWNDGKGGDDYKVTTPPPAAPRTNADELNHPTRPPVYKCDDGALVMLEMNQLGGSRLTIAWPDDHASAYVHKVAGREHPYILIDTVTRQKIGDARITPQTVWLYVGDGFLHCNRSIK